jgi:Tfp pilus assembly protein PilO
MNLKNRQQLLLFVAIAAAGLFAADKLIATPLSHFWTARAKRIAELRKKIQDGTELQRREMALRRNWEHMRSNSLPNNSSVAEQQVFRAFDQWSQDSGVTINSISPQWKHDADEYMTLQCRVEAAGDLSRLTRFLYDIEKDPMALKFEIMELSAHDTDGQQLALGLQVSGLVFTSPAKGP